MTVGAGQVATLKLRRPQDYAAFFVGHELGDIAWYLFVALLLVLGRGRLSDELYHLLLRICAAVILLFGAVFVFLAVRPWLRPGAGGEKA